MTKKTNPGSPGVKIPTNPIPTHPIPNPPKRIRTKSGRCLWVISPDYGTFATEFGQETLSVIEDE